MVIIKESKRDDLLLPYLEMVRQRGVEMTLGQFKTYMLEHLASRGGIHNLSLSSNYYLAGVTKYYFNGDLTLNKDLAVYKGEMGANDQWNEEVCKRLDALVLILRNAYIDTVGEKFEIEEDFGKLSLPRLLRKYNKKINEALGIVDDKKKDKEKEEKVYDHNVGNGYTYEILYSYPQGTKYERYTAPGSWCITYGEHHYNYYIRHLGIHYVIFLKNGYENVPRQTGPGYTKQKPHDEYGNSMIALLQKNDNWQPTYITSRWNHGSYDDGTAGTEADHAYTLEEFEQITGVSSEDLQRIWQEWNENKSVVHREVDPRKAELRQEKKEVLRKLKYAQMRFNGGELPQNLFFITERIFGPDNPDGTANFRKGIFVAELKPSENEGSNLKHYKFVIDRGKVLFETLSNWWESSDPVGAKLSQAYFNRATKPTPEEPNKKSGVMQNAIIITTDNGYMIYDIRRKDYVTVGTTKRFKYIPDRWSECGEYKNPLFYTVALRGKQMAFIFCSNNQPLKLPNGEFWFNSYSSRDKRTSYYGNALYFEFAGYEGEDIIEIVYDESSREKYFYNVKQRRFIEIPDISDTKTGDSSDEVILSTSIDANGMYGLRYKPRGWYGDSTPAAIFNDNNERITIGGLDKFYSVKEVFALDEKKNPTIKTGIYVVRITNDDQEKLVERGYSFQSMGSNKEVVYDSTIGAFLVIKGNELVTGSSNSTEIKDNYFFHRVYSYGDGAYSRTSGYFYYIYDTNAKGLVMNPSGYPSKYLFEIYELYNANSVSDIEVFTTPRAESWYRDYSRPRTRIDLKSFKIDNSTLIMAERDKHHFEQEISQNTQPAVSLAEADIRTMVAEAIKKITTNL